MSENINGYVSTQRAKAEAIKISAMLWSTP